MKWRPRCSWANHCPLLASVAERAVHSFVSLTLIRRQPVRHGTVTPANLKVTSLYWPYTWMSVRKRFICLCRDVALSRTVISARSNVVSCYAMPSALIALCFILYWFLSTFHSIRDDEALRGPDSQLRGPGPVNIRKPLSVVHVGHDGFSFFRVSCDNWGGHGRVVVEALRCKPDGPGLKTRWGIWIVSIYLTIPAALSPRFTQQLTDISARGRNRSVSRE